MLSIASWDILFAREAFASASDPVAGMAFSVPFVVFGVFIGVVCALMVRHVLAAKRLVGDLEGRLERTASEKEDLADRFRRATTELARLVDDQAFLLNNIGDVVYRYGVDGTFVYLSPSIERLTGYSAREWRENFESYLSDAKEADQAAAIRQRILSGQEEEPHYELSVRHKSGQIIYVEVNERPFVEGGVVIGIVGVMRDITARRQAEAEFGKANRELQESVQAKTRQLQEAVAYQEAAREQLLQSEKLATLGELVAGLSHEVGTPLGIGVTALSYLQDKVKSIRSDYSSGNFTRSSFESGMDAINEAAGSALLNIRRASDLMKSFKEIAADRATEAFRFFNVRNYFEEISLSLRPVLKNTKFDLEIIGPDDLEIESLPSAFSQMLTNFVMNSLLHGFEGRESGKMAVEYGLEGNTFFMIYTDNGKGMTEEQMKHVFTPFFTSKKGKGGTGLGMYVVQELVEVRLGGTIAVASVEERGVEFRIEIPLCGRPE